MNTQEKIQVELNKQSEYGVVYVVTLTPIDLECGGTIQDDKMRVYTDEGKANERFSLWKKEAVEYLLHMTESKDYNVDEDTPFTYAVSSSDGNLCIYVKILERILIQKDDIY